MYTFRFISTVFAVSMFSLSGCSEGNNTKQESQALNVTENSRPNILYILADDMGFLDIGAYGSEIPTPNIDQLAKDGMLMTQFYNQAVCAPTRASLLSGLDDHQAGGTMHAQANQRGTPGYESELRREVVTLPEILSSGGYRTYMAGKWHLGQEPDLQPHARGFDRSFVLVQSGASHWEDKRGMFDREPIVDYVKDGIPIETLREGFYSTIDYTDSIIEFIDDDLEQDQPWFTYLAYTAPHWPLQAPDAYIAKYSGKYDMGYEVLREQRIERARALGVIPANAPAYKRLDHVAPWDSLTAEEKRISAKEMEIYAAMVDLLDENIGRLIEHLKDTGDYDNTLIAFVTDNGAEGQDRPPGDNWGDFEFDNSYENMGRINSHIYYGPEWAQAGVGVFSYFKSLASEGGIHGAAIFSHPDMPRKGVKSDAINTLRDIYPTALDLAEIETPKAVNGKPMQDLPGRTMVPLLMESAPQVHPEGTAFGWEVFGSFAIRKDEWKMLRLTNNSSDRGLRGKVPDIQDWELFNLATDPGETKNVADQHPEIVADLMLEWEAYIEDNGVVLPIVTAGGGGMGGPPMGGPPMGAPPMGGTQQ